MGQRLVPAGGAGCDPAGSASTAWRSSWPSSRVSRCTASRSANTSPPVSLCPTTLTQIQPSGEMAGLGSRQNAGQVNVRHHWTTARNTDRHSVPGRQLHTGRLASAHQAGSGCGCGAVKHSGRLFADAPRGRAAWSALVDAAAGCPLALDAGPVIPQRLYAHLSPAGAAALRRRHGGGVRRGTSLPRAGGATLLSGAGWR